MKISNFKFLLAVVSIFYVGCSTQQTVRQPQSSVYEEVEIFTDDVDATDDLEIFEDTDDKNANTSRFFRVCREPKSQEIKANDRVVTMLDGKHVSGNVESSYGNGSTFFVSTDYGPESTLQKNLKLKRTPQELSKALECMGTKSKKLYGAFLLGNKFSTGHVREVFRNGIVRFVDDRSHERFTTIDQSLLEITRSNLKLKSVLFNKDGALLKGQIRRRFEKDVLLIKYNDRLFLRKLNEVQVID